jgi:hypothetical protein
MRLPFVLRTFDNETGCWLQQWKLSSSIEAQLPDSISVELPAIGETVFLNDSDCRNLTRLFSLASDTQLGTVELERVDEEFNLDNTTHTGRELWLMLNAKKPLSAFVEVLPQDNGLGLIPEDYFEPFVINERVVKYEFGYVSKSLNNRRCRRVLYAIPGQEWRFKAYEMLWLCAENYGWNLGFERIEGFLLGYETSLDSFSNQTSRS